METIKLYDCFPKNSLYSGILTWVVKSGKLRLSWLRELSVRRPWLIWGLSSHPCLQHTFAGFSPIFKFLSSFLKKVSHMGEQLDLLRCIFMFYYCSNLRRRTEKFTALWVWRLCGKSTKGIEDLLGKLKGTEARFLNSSFFQGSTVLYIRLRFRD